MAASICKTTLSKRPNRAAPGEIEKAGGADARDGKAGADQGLDLTRGGYGIIQSALEWLIEDRDDAAAAEEGFDREHGSMLRNEAAEADRIWKQL